jgi:hypothetical protein
VIHFQYSSSVLVYQFLSIGIRAKQKKRKRKLQGEEKKAAVGFFVFSTE